MKVWTKKTVKCPVCKTILGSKEPTETASFHCDECQATYTYTKCAKKPTAILDRAICNCASCRGKREQEEEESNEDQELDIEFRPWF
jgi:endogenous inhibitor of DNA gyrase (YacG/DUF329 family)